LINKRNKESIIKKWEKEISLSQKEKAFEILDKFNLDIYIKDKYTINKNSYFFNRGY
jgi:hypothetical protein